MLYNQLHCLFFFLSQNIFNLKADIDHTGGYYHTNNDYNYVAYLYTQDVNMIDTGTCTIINMLALYWAYIIANISWVILLYQNNAGVLGFKINNQVIKWYFSN